jgi:hypothetical protein
MVATNTTGSSMAMLTVAEQGFGLLQSKVSARSALTAIVSGVAAYCLTNPLSPLTATEVSEMAVTRPVWGTVLT